MKEAFEIKHEDLLGRIGCLRTEHGTIETPALLPVINPAKNVLEANEIVSIGFDALITNAYLIRRYYGDIALELGVHGILGVSCPIMTDSGAYQLLVYGNVEVDPEEIVLYQVRLGSDIGVVLDIPTKLGTPKEEVWKEVKETLRRVKRALELDLGTMLLVGPVQGGLYLDIVAYSAKSLAELEVDVYAVGGPTQFLENYRYSDLVKLVMTARMHLPPDRPLHLFGAGHPMIIPLLAAMGVDMFDSASYALYARDGRYMTPYGTLRVNELSELPCECPVCRKYDIESFKQLPREVLEEEVARHNLYVLHREIALVKQAIREGTLWNLLESRARAHPALMSALNTLRRYIHTIEARHPVTHGTVKAEFFFDGASRWRPSVYRYLLRLRFRYQPPQDKIAVLVPDWPSRPFTRYGWVAELLRSLDDSFRNKLHFIAYSPPYGVVPEELSETYPLSQYEIPEDPTGLLMDSLRDLAWYFRRHSKAYSAAVILAPNYVPRRYLNALLETLKGLRLHTIKLDVDLTQNVAELRAKLYEVVSTLTRGTEEKV